MPDTAEAHLQHLTANRVCVIEMKNYSKVFRCCNPKVFCESGSCFSPPNPTLNHGMQEVFSFTKDYNTASGAVGVMTYDLFNINDCISEAKMAIMFSVPYDYNFYENWLAIGIYDLCKVCDDKLYCEMYNDECTNFVRYKSDGSGISCSGKSVEVRASMSDDGRAIVKLQLCDKPE